ncbi:methyl-accepting chemotaxis domain-containing protein (plasmid) [Rhizobium gallicum]|uniref:Methyl-accepting chemotaxis domain-containing protein n=1 Tax=Rhizobium gallicum TaxID=56730 RepID=A0A1L5NSI8_9HYPH|nr:methyl-accepting chemotaxis domain-containing protein [Rhizobium gallicum]
MNSSATCRGSTSDQRPHSKVERGSFVRRKTGSADRIVTVAERVATIATASRDQSNALAEVNASVNEMDQMTQRNAAMVEETNAATRQLADEAETLMEIVGQFRLPDHPAHSRVHEDYAAQLCDRSSADRWSKR